VGFRRRPPERLPGVLPLRHRHFLVPGAVTDPARILHIFPSSPR
jgi:hypothetical protein